MNTKTQYRVSGFVRDLPSWLLHHPDVTFMGDSVDDERVMIYIRHQSVPVGSIIILENQQLCVQQGSL